MKINCEQGSSEWFAARCGRVTSSRVADAIATLKRKEGEAAKRANLKAALVAETLTRIHQDSYVSKAMQFGSEQEPLARALYEVRNDVAVDQVGFYTHPRIERAGASPDGLVGNDGLVEIKCPNTTTHIGYLRGKVPPEEYRPQMLWAMACSEREWCDFVSFDPRLPDHLQLFTVRYEINCEALGLMELAVKQFLSEVDEILDELKAEDSLTITAQDVMQVV